MGFGGSDNGFAENYLAGQQLQMDKARDIANQIAQQGARDLQQRMADLEQQRFDFEQQRAAQADKNNADATEQQQAAARDARVGHTLDSITSIIQQGLTTGTPGQALAQAAARWKSHEYAFPNDLPGSFDDFVGKFYPNLASGRQAPGQQSAQPGQPAMPPQGMQPGQPPMPAGAPAPGGGTPMPPSVAAMLYGPAAAAAMGAGFGGIPAAAMAANAARPPSPAPSPLQTAMDASLRATMASTPGIPPTFGPTIPPDQFPPLGGRPTGEGMFGAPAQPPVASLGPMTGLGVGALAGVAQSANQQAAQAAQQAQPGPYDLLAQRMGLGDPGTIGYKASEAVTRQIQATAARDRVAAYVQRAQQDGRLKELDQQIKSRGQDLMLQFHQWQHEDAISRNEIARDRNNVARQRAADADASATMRTVQPIFEAGIRITNMEDRYLSDVAKAKATLGALGTKQPDGTILPPDSMVNPNRAQAFAKAQGELAASQAALDELHRSDTFTFLFGKTDPLTGAKTPGAWNEVRDAMQARMGGKLPTGARGPKTDPNATPYDRANQLRRLPPAAAQQQRIYRILQRVTGGG